MPDTNIANKLLQMISKIYCMSARVLLDRNPTILSLRFVAHSECEGDHLERRWKTADR